MYDYGRPIMTIAQNAQTYIEETLKCFGGGDFPMTHFGCGSNLPPPPLLAVPTDVT